MSIFKSIRKGFKKVFKKIGGAIKKQFKRIGKFINKAGILGQLAMMFILPGVGGALMKGLGSLVGATAAGTTTAAATSAAAASAGTAASTAVGTGTATAAQTATIKAGELAAKSLAKQVGKGILKKSAEGVFTATRGTGLLGSSSALANGVGSVLKAAGNFVKVGAKAFSTVTEGISSFIGEFSKAALNKIPGVNIGSAAPTMGQAWKNVQNSVMQNASGTVQAFNTSIGIEPTAGSTKFGTEGFKVADRVSVDSIAAKNAPIDSNTFSSNAKDLLTGKDAPLQSSRLNMQDPLAATDIVNPTAPAYTQETMPDFLSGVDAGDVRSYQIGQNPSNSLLADPKVTTPTPESTYQRLQRQNIPTPTSADRAFKQTFKQTGTDIATPGSDPSVANLNFREQIVQNVSALPGKIKQSILDFPTNLAKVPEQFVDNLTDTITKLPSTAATAALNRRPADQVTNNQVALGNIPESTYGMNQSNIAESGIAVAGYQSKVNPTALYGNQNQAYDQFFKMMGPQAQQMRA